MNSREHPFTHKESNMESVLAFADTKVGNQNFSHFQPAVETFNRLSARLADLGTFFDSVGEPAVNLDSTYSTPALQRL